MMTKPCWNGLYIVGVNGFCWMSLLSWDILNCYIRNWMYLLILDGWADLGNDMALVLWEEKASAMKIVFWDVMLCILVRMYFCCLHHQGKRISCTQNILTDIGSGWTEAELWLHLWEEGVGVRVQKNKMGPFSGTFQEWNKKARKGAVSFYHYSERHLIYPHLKIFPSKNSE
jgi:hypothetical protein